MKKQEDPKSLQFDHYKAGQLVIVTQGPMMKVGAQMNPWTGQVVMGGKVRNEGLVGTIFKVLDVSLPFLAVQPMTPINNANRTGVIDLRSGMRFQEVTQAFLDHLLPPKPPAPAPNPLVSFAAEIILGAPPAGDDSGFIVTQPAPNEQQCDCGACRAEREAMKGSSGFLVLEESVNEDDDEDDGPEISFDDEDGCGDDD